MTFADSDLAARIEGAEARLITDGATAAVGRRGTDAVIVTSLAGGVAVHVEPQSPLNKVVGIGFGPALDIDRLETLEREFAARCCPLQFELSTLADPSIGSTLTQRGYRLVGFENVLGLELATAPFPAIAEGIDIRSREVELDRWLDVVVSGFAAPDLPASPVQDEIPRELIERVIADLASLPTLTRYLASRDGVAVGGASLRVDQGIAQLCGAATLPEHRRRGVQSALLAMRLADARNVGCDFAVVTTQPGSKSQQNAQRQGFALLYSRAVLVLDPACEPSATG